MSSTDLVAQADRAEPARADIFRTLTALSVALLAVALLWAVSGEPRTVAGGPVWIKPAKFALSFVVFFWTLALIRDRLSPVVREGRTLKTIGAMMAIAFIAEMAWMFRQAARAAESHFNLSTPFEATMYSLMGVGAVSLVVGAGVIGWLVRRDADARMGPVLREGIWLGLMLGAVLTLVVAGTMSSGTSPYVGVPPDGAPTLPFIGWSGAVGDLRPAHFLAIHAMQALPLLAVWLERRSVRGGLRILRLAAFGWTALTLAVFAQALLGLPLIDLR